MPIQTTKVKAAVRAILLDLKLPDSELSLVLASLEEMATYNQKYMGRNGPTDVLSFPAAEYPHIEGQPQPLGDIIICPEKVKRQALSHQRMYRIEFAHVLIHGILHLKGFDHDIPSRAKVMRGEERRLLPHIQKKLVGFNS